MEQYYIGDEVVRIKFSTGMLGKIIKQLGRQFYQVEVLTTVPTSHTPIGTITEWSTAFFRLHKHIPRTPDWEV